jgi:shikimate dehydrogenase
MPNWTVSAKTKIYGLIGDPVEQTLSPVMFNTAFQNLGLDCKYIPFNVTKEHLDGAIEGMRALNIRGFNITIPHKVAVIKYLDEVTSVARKIGAVNTIVNCNGILKGYNTDAPGFLKALLEQSNEIKGKNIVILGAGGASRSISFVLAKKGANLIILNRTPAKAMEYAAGISKFFKLYVETMELNPENLKKAIDKADILVNTTSVGMRPHISDTLVNSELIKSSLIVFDIVYNPVKTRLLVEAEKAGARIISGVEMLVWQGALAFEKWTGIKAPVEIMRKETIRALERHED